MMSSIAKNFKANNLTYSPFEMNITNSNIHEDLKRELGNERSSEFFFELSYLILKM